MLQSGPSTSGGQSSNPPHTIPHNIDVKVLYCKYDTEKGYIFGKECTLWEIGRELCCVNTVIPKNNRFHVVRVTMGKNRLAVIQEFLIEMLPFLLGTVKWVDNLFFVQGTKTCCIQLHLTNLIPCT